MLFDEGDELKLQAAVAMLGPVAVAIDDSGLMGYTSGTCAAVVIMLALVALIIAFHPKLHRLL